MYASRARLPHYMGMHDDTLEGTNYTWEFTHICDGHQNTGMHAQIMGAPTLGNAYPYIGGATKAIQNDNVTVHSSTESPATRVWEVLAIV
jgi:hypothetical protein